MRRLLLLLLVAACAGSASDAGPTPTAPSIPTPPAGVSVQTVTVTSPAPSLAVGASLQLTATTANASGTALTGRIVNWTSSAASVVSVTAAGLATALAPGTATITATSEQKSGSTVLLVPTVVVPPSVDLFTSLGTILTPASFGVTSGPVADATAIQLADGRVRLYLFAQGQGTRSAISTSDAGTSFTPEAGVRSTTPAWGQPRVVRLPDGRVRLFYFAADGIRSATSSDGLAFTDDPGIRIAKTTTGYEIGVPTIVAVPSGGYRAYFSDLERPGAPAGGHYIRSAVSSDLTTWTLEPGIVLGVGATSGVTQTATHPFAVANANGSVTLYYQGDRAEPGSQNGYLGLFRATSTDGRTFTTEEKTGIQRGGDPDLITLTNGTTLMYYGDVEATGGVIRVAKLNR